MVRSPLAERLRSLRTDADLTQRQVGRALGASVPLISSWEKATIPPDHRLETYARLFACLAGRGPALTPVDELTAAEISAYERLHGELLLLRDPSSPTGGVQSPLKFGPGEAITIVCSQLPDEKRALFGNTDRSDADFIDSYKFADLDALITLLPFVVAQNPDSNVTVGTADELSPNDMTAHLIVLGGVDWNPVTAALMTFLADVPVHQFEREADDNVGGFSIRSKDGPVRLTPTVLPARGRAALVEDVAHFLRTRNPYNRQRTLTIFNGMFSRGSYGVVRALTDPKIRDRNAGYVARVLSAYDTYSVVCRVKIVASEVVVPDWTLADDRLHIWPEADQ
jgi:transcriptional regulator with XRE-family HTH domain